jgi:hypothetical protein
MKVRANSVYTYRPMSFWDQLDPKTTLQSGDKVRVVNLYGCPPCNTMGQCHVEDMDGNFRGMVSTNSLFRE